MEVFVKLDSPVKGFVASVTLDSLEQIAVQVLYISNYNGRQKSLVHCCNAANYLCFIAEF